MAQNPTRRYKSTESKYKGGAKEMYVTYDLKQKTRGNGPALYHKIKRVYIAGDVTNWESGEVQKRSGRQVSGVLIDYKQTRAGHQRKEYTAQRAKTTYKVKPATVKGSSQRFRQVVRDSQRRTKCALLRGREKTTQKISKRFAGRALG